MTTSYILVQTLPSQMASPQDDSTMPHTKQQSLRSLQEYQLLDEAHTIITSTQGVPFNQQHVRKGIGKATHSSEEQESSLGGGGGLEVSGWGRVRRGGGMAGRRRAEKTCS